METKQNIHEFEMVARTDDLDAYKVLCVNGRGEIWTSNSVGDRQKQRKMREWGSEIKEKKSKNLLVTYSD